MKKIGFLSVIMSMFLISGCESGPKVISKEDLPKQALEFAITHVPDTEIALVVKDGNEYEVGFVNGWTIEFNRRGEWKEFDSLRDGIPESMESIIPEAILNTVKSKFIALSIYDVKKEGNIYELKLDTGFEVEMNSKGEILDISM